MSDGVTLDNDLSAKVRNLRLYHWCEAMTHRRTQSRYADLLGRGNCDVRRVQTLMVGAKNMADMHLHYVQILNEFFPVGDTAEKDAEKCALM